MEPPALETLRSSLAAEGLDLTRAFDVAAYDEVARAHPQLSPLAAFGRASALALIVGNTRALWPRFVAAYARDERLRASPDPLDEHVASVVTRALDETGAPYEARFAHERGERLVSMLHAAEASGLACVGPAHLAVHPRLGPWFGLRAVVVFDAPPPEVWGAPATPCEGCAAPCRAALDRALAEATQPPQIEGPGWRSWLAVRDACPLGRSGRYGDDQLLYHYTKDRGALDAAMRAGEGA